MANTRNTRNRKNSEPFKMPIWLGNSLQQSGWLILGLLSLYLGAALFSYHPLDPAWSHVQDSDTQHALQNYGGLVGAWLADISFYTAGIAAWGLIIASVRLLWLRFWVLRNTSPVDRSRPLWISFIGFVITFISFAGFASLRLYSLPLNLPDPSTASGGALGALVGVSLQHGIGFFAASFVLLSIAAYGCSLWFAFSWLNVFEWLGIKVERLWTALMDKRQQQQEAKALWQQQAARETPAPDAFEEDFDAIFTPKATTAPIPAPEPTLRETKPEEVAAPLLRFARQRTENTAPSASPVVTTAKQEPRINWDDPLLADINAPQTANPQPHTMPLSTPPMAEEPTSDYFSSSAFDEPVFDSEPSPIVPPPLLKDYSVPAKAEPIIFADTPAQAVVMESKPQHIEKPKPVRYGTVELPPITLLEPPPTTVEQVSRETIEYTSRLIERKLKDFNVSVKVVAAYPGPVITRYEIEPAVGVKGSQIVNLMKDLARALGMVSVRVVETIPGKTYMGLELPNPKRQIVRLSEIICSKPYQDMASKITIAMGKDISGEPIVADLAKMPHGLVAGTTGSGKSVAINAMLLSLLFKSTAEEVRLILIDPKMLEMSIYEGIPHLLAPVVTDMKHAANALNWCVGEMERRYRLMSAMGVRNLAGYNEKIKHAQQAGNPIYNPFTLTPDDPEPLDTMPLIVVVIDELADLMMVAGKKIEELIARLAQKARAAGIHLILATQRPSVDVITGLIKANIPTRVAFQVSSKIDSRTILDQMGAETLLGQGDMLFLPPGTGYPQRIHGAFVADDEVHRVVDFLKLQGEPNYIEGILEGGMVDDAAGGGEFSFTGQADGSAEKDPLYDEAVSIVIKTRKASISSVQRALRIGYNRSARLIDEMEAAGIVSPAEHNGNRKVLVAARED